MFERRPKLLLALTVVLFFWRLALTTQFTLLESPDLAYQVLPWYQVQARAWHNGEFPLWDPFQWAGQPLLGQMQPGGAFPLNWPLFWAPLHDGFIQLKWIHRHYVLMHLLAALLFYGLARHLGRSRWASVVGGIAFMAAGYVGSVAWPQMLHGAIWLPLIFWLFHRAAEAEWGPVAWRRGVLCGGAIGMALLSGHHQTPIFGLLALTGVFCYFLHGRWQQGKMPALRWTLLYGGMAAFAFVLAALQILPALEYGEDAYRWVETADPVTSDMRVPYYAQYELRLFPVTLIGLVLPRAHFQVSTFVGVAVLTFALLGIALGWRKRWVRMYTTIAVVGIAYAVGPYSIFHGVIYAILPFADKARSAGHSVYVAQFAMVVLACYGLDAVRELRGDARAVTWAKRGLLIFAGACLFILFGQAVIGKMDAPPGDQFMLAALIAVVLAWILHGASRQALSPNAQAWALFVLVVFELGTGQWVKIVDRRDPGRPHYLESLDRHAEIFDFLAQQERPFRYEIRSGEQEANLGGWHGIEAVDGFLASVNRDLYDFFAPDWGGRRRMLNMKYTVTKEGPWADEVEVFAGADGWKVYRNEDAYPRVWVEPGAGEITTADREPVTALEVACDGNEAEWVSGEATRVVGRAALSCPAYVVFAEPFFPGWEGRIDGERAPVYRAYGALRAFLVPAGEHTIETVYRPWTVRLGAVLTSIGFLVCFACGWVDWRRRS